MTDKEKLEKLVAYLMRKMYAHNQMADIGSTGEIFDEKIENAKYEECKDTLNFIDTMQEELTIPDIVDEHYWEMLGEEPVSEDLKEEIGKYCSNPENFITYIDVGFKQSPIEKDDIPLIIKAIEFGANWQKKKDESYTKSMYKVGINTGKVLIKEQLMAEAIDTTIKQGCTDLGILIKGLDEDKFSFGDKVKVVIIKED